jgi:hypothetical protein
VKQRRFRTATAGALALAAALLSVLSASAGARAKPAFGKLAGVVRDAVGTPQMGATVQVVSETGPQARPNEYLTNTLGAFRGERLAPGLYTVRVTLAGFLPTLEQHVRVAASFTTVLRIEMESLFASLDQLRRPSATSDADDWKWVLRSSASMRPVLQWMEENQTDTVSEADGSARRRSSSRLELTSGGRHPGSVSNLADAAGTAFAYDQRVGAVGRLLLAGQMSYERAPAGGVATIWLPSGSLEAGPRTTVVLRESKLGWGGPTFRGVRMDQSGVLGLGERVAMRYGAEYVLVGLGNSASSLRPRMEILVHVKGDWTAAFIFTAQPGARPYSQPEGDGGSEVLAAAINQLDAFPALLWRNGHPVLEGGWHEEIALRRKLGERGSLQVAALHDDNRHVAVFGTGSGLANTEFLRDFFSHGFVTEGGSYSAWGARVAVREKISDTVEITAIYALAGALAPGNANGEIPMEDLRDGLREKQRQTLSAGVGARVPRLGTQIHGGYKWLSGRTVSRVDGYGEALFQDDPYLHVSVRQALPRLGLGRWEALAECQNLLEQGYVPVNGRNGGFMLVPAFRTFRGGLSLQF